MIFIFSTEILSQVFESLQTKENYFRFVDKVLPKETEVKPLTEEIKDDIKAQNEMLNHDGLRVIGVAYKIMDLHLDGDDVPYVISKETECNLTFL